MPATTAASQRNSPPLEPALQAIRRSTDFVPEVALVLGSGLGPLADEIDPVAIISYDDVPGMIKSTAPGHAGEFYLGTLSGRRVVAMKGRVHLYDGVSSNVLGLPVRIMHALGARSLIVSNACGGMRADWNPGDLMLQRDFINFSWDNPLIGPNDDSAGPRFPVMFDAYDGEYQQLARAEAVKQSIDLREGVYLAISGPSYSTRAELRAYMAWGADAVGMSTVHEVITARHLDMRVLGLSVVTDLALPDGHEHTTGDDVVKVAEMAGGRFRSLVRAVLPRI